jgi:hypothetical protein
MRKCKCAQIKHVLSSNSLLCIRAPFGIALFEVAIPVPFAPYFRAVPKSYREIGEIQAQVYPTKGQRRRICAVRLAEQEVLNVLLCLDCRIELASSLEDKEYGYSCKIDRLWTRCSAG